MAASRRPKVITLLAWLAIISGILSILVGLISLFVGAIATQVDGGMAAQMGGIFIFLVILGFLNLIFGFGALALKPWAWGYGVGLQISDIVFGLLSLPQSIISILISGLILYYLFRPNVKRIFGKA